MPALIVIAAMILVGVLAWIASVKTHHALSAPRVKPETIRKEVRRHHWLASAVRSRLDPQSTTGLALTIEFTAVVVGGVMFAVLLFMVRSNRGFAHFDLGAAHYGASHATSLSTSILNVLTQLGGALVVIPLAVVVAVAGVRNRRWLRTVGFLLLVVGGQFVLANAIKGVVNRVRPNINQLTGFSSSSFPSGHAVAAAASFAAFAYVLGFGRSSRTRSIFTGIAAGLAVGIGMTRVFLGVHWLTDVLAGLFLGWGWFALCSIAFGGRLFRFGAPAEQAERELGSA